MKSSLIHLILLTLLFIATIVGYQFWYGEVVAQSAAIARIEKELAAEQGSASRLVSERTALENLAEEEMLVQSYFITDSDVAELIDDLQARGRVQGVAVTVGSVSKNESTARPTLHLTLTIVGTFDAIMRTVGIIEYLPHDSQVTGLTLDQDEQKNWHATLELVIGSPAVLTAPPAKKKSSKSL